MEEMKSAHLAAAEAGYSLMVTDNEVRALKEKESIVLLSQKPQNQAHWKEIMTNLQRITSDKGSTAGNNDELVIYADGGSRGNPGPSASGFVIYDSEEKVLEKGGEYLGITTNNQAEYNAVKQALEAAQKYLPAKVSFYLDSQLVVNQMNGVYKVRNKDLWPVHEAIKELAKKFESVKYSHVRREFNTEADAVVNEILDERDTAG